MATLRVTIRFLLRQLFLISSDKSIVAFDTGKDVITSGASANGTIAAVESDEIKKAGTVKLTAYLENDDTVSKSINVTIKPTALSTITVAADPTTGAGTLENNKAAYYELSFNTGASVAAADLVSEVKEADKKALATTEIVEGDDKNLTIKGKVYLKVTPTANGKENAFTVKVSYKADATKTVEKALTSSVNQVVTDITVTPFKENAVTANSTDVTTPVEMKNANGEDITLTRIADSGKISVVADSDTVTDAAVKNVNGVGVLSLKASKVGNFNVVVRANLAQATVAVNVVAEAALTEVTAPKTSTTYANVIAGDAEVIAANRISVAALDQYKNAYALKKSDITTTDTSDVTLVAFKADGSVAADDSDVVTAIGFTATSGKTAGNYTVNVSFGTITKKFVAQVTADRAIATLEATADYSKIVKGQDVLITITAKDQYGVVYGLADVEGKKVESAAGTANYSDGKATLTITCDTVGKQTVTVTGNNKTATVNYEVVNASAVDGIKFVDGVKGNGSKVYDTAKYSVYVNGSSDSVVADYDAYVGTEKVKIDKSLITVQYSGVANPTTGVVALDAGKTGTVVASVINKLNDKDFTVTKSFTVDTTAPAIATYAFKNGVNYATAISSLVVKKADGATVKFTAADQYGQEIVTDLSAEASILKFSDDVNATTTIKGDNQGVITITATAQTAPITISVVVGTKQYKLPVTFAD